MKVEKGKQIGVLLFDSEEDFNIEQESFTGLCMDMEYKVRKDVNEYFRCDYDYSKCGFVAKINKDMISADKVYKIVIKPDYQKEIGIVSTAYLYENEISFVNPLEVPDLIVDDTDLEKLLNNGVCLANCPDVGVSIYQIGWKLYWIMDENYPFESDGGTYIDYMLETTQFNRLPANRLENKWYWSNIGGSFETYEVTNEINCGKYRVAIRDIPTEYSVTRIDSGYRMENEWLWHCAFRPVYSLKP